jgi:hypothetical protein
MMTIIMNNDHKLALTGASSFGGFHLCFTLPLKNLCWQTCMVPIQFHQSAKFIIHAFQEAMSL